MKIQNLQFALIVLFIFQSYFIFAQTSKYGKVSKEELEMETYDLDPDAEAVVLFDVGETRIQSEGGWAWRIVFTRHRRIKILNEEGLRFADIEIPYYSNFTENIQEDIKGIDAATYFFNEKGKVDNLKVKQSEIFEEEVSENFFLKKFALSGVTVGSIIEYRYEVVSNIFYRIEDWYFQDVIPTKYSNYSFRYPQYFDYKPFSSGYLPFTNQDRQIKFVDMGLEDASANNENHMTQYDENQFTWTIENVPAFRGEKYYGSFEDNVSKIEFQLNQYAMPGQLEENVSRTWQNVDIELREATSFGKQLKKENAVQEYISDLIQDLNTDEEKIFAIIQDIKNNFIWNKVYGIYTQNGVRQTLNSKEGNVADINLLLTVCFRAAGLKAYPVLISTRGNGKVNPVLPSTAAFNYVASCVELNGQLLPIDATASLCKIGELPYRCSNNLGRILMEDGGTWVDLNTSEGFKESTTLMLTLNDNKLEGDFRFSRDGYAAINSRSNIIVEGEEEYFNSLAGDFSENISFSDLSHSNLENLEKSFVVNGKVSLEKENLGGRYYVDCFQKKVFNKNPFNQEERIYPVDFGAPISDSYFFAITLPENITVEEIPESISFALPNEAGKYQCQFLNAGSQIQVKAKFEINQTVFQPSEYLALREFISLVIENQASQIILKTN